MNLTSFSRSQRKYENFEPVWWGNLFSLNTILAILVYPGLKHSVSLLSSCDECSVMPDEYLASLELYLGDFFMLVGWVGGVEVGA